jgi:hypothetical protein
MYGFCGNMTELFDAAAKLQAWITDRWETRYGKEHEEPTVEVSVISYAARVTVGECEIWNSEYSGEEPTYEELLRLFREECGRAAIFAETDK